MVTRPKPDTNPQLKQLKPTTFVDNGILNGEEITPTISTWLYKNPPPKGKELLDYFKRKYPHSHCFATEQQDYQGSGLGHEELGIRQPVEAYKEDKKKGLGYGLHVTGGTTKDGHAFLNIHNNLEEIGDIPKEVEKKAYNNIFLDKLIIGTFVLYELSINLIDLPLTHPELIYWDQPSVIHVNKFSMEHVLHRFIRAKIPHKKPPPQLAYVYKLDPKGYFGENEIYRHKNDHKKEIKNQKRKEKVSPGHNSSRAPSNH